MKKLLAIALFPVAALAVEDKEIATCAANSNDVQRLACFDQLAERHGLTAKTVETKFAGKGKWYTSTKTDPLTDKSVYVAMLDADQGSGRYGKTIDLVVRCQNNTTELYINWQSYLGMDSTRITL